MAPAEEAGSAPANEAGDAPAEEAVAAPEAEAAQVTFEQAVNPKENGEHASLGPKCDPRSGNNLLATEVRVMLLVKEHATNKGSNAAILKLAAFLLNPRVCDHYDHEPHNNSLHRCSRRRSSAPF